MDWHVRYKRDAGDHVEWFKTPEAAIVSACELIDEGVDVYGIGTDDLADTIDRGTIDRIHALRARERTPFSLEPAWGTPAWGTPAWGTPAWAKPAQQPTPKK